MEIFTTVCRKQMAFFYLMELTNQNSNYEKEHDYCAHSPCRYDRFYTFSIMKKLTFITASLLIVVVGLLSCKKEYSCVSFYYAAVLLLIINRPATYTFISTNHTSFLLVNLLCFL